MIIYELTCGQAHRFEGWFASGEEFARQQGLGLVTCPMCSDPDIVRVPSARVSVPKGGARTRAPRGRPVETPPAGAGTPAAESAPSTGGVAAGLPPEVLAKMREMVKHTENVGARFPEEARKIHYEETAPRAIRGQASPEEARALNDEGIEFSSVPPFLLPDSH